MIRDIREAFESMDELIDEIDCKNSSYQRAAINRAKFLLSYGEDVTGQIKEILLKMGEEISAQQIGLNCIYEIDFMTDLFSLYGMSFLDEESLYKPIEGKKQFKPEALIVNEVNPEQRAAKLAKMKAKFRETMSVGQIENYVKMSLGDKKVMKASMLPMETKADFIKLIYIRLYGQRKRLSYWIKPGEMVQVGHYRFRDFEIWRKK